MPSIRTITVGLVAGAAAAVSIAAVPAGAATPSATTPSATTPSGTTPSGTTPNARPAGNAAGMSPNSGSVTAAAIAANEKTAFDYFVGKGLTKRQAAAIVGNFDQESGMNPEIKQSGGGPGRGIAQWSVGGRWDTYSGDNEVHYTNVVLGVSRYNLTGQLKFTWHELTDFSNYGLSALKNTTTIDSAVVVFQDRFEGCGDCNTTARKNYAHSVYDRFA